MGAWRCSVGAGLVVVCAALAAGAVDDLDDVLGGFDDEEEPAFRVERESDAATQDEAWWDLSGSVEISASVNYRSHESATGTDYGGLQRLRNRLNLQLDAELPRAWQTRLEAWGFYDAAYLLNGRGSYTTQVRNQYETDWDVGEAWLHGPILDDVDLKLGRQIVIWGRSETLRVLDVLNPLDNREPGRVDLEDIRRPLGMARLDAYADEWTVTAIAIPEIRFDENPVVGSDFLPLTGVPPSQLPPQRKPDSFEDWEAAAAITGTFSGWDASLHGAWFFDDQPHLRDSGRLAHARLWMVGTGGNYTLGSWLWKGELAYLDGLEFFGASEKSRVDVLVGVEYYGFVDTSISLEGVNRHLIDYDSGVRNSLDIFGEDFQELSLRITRSFLNERLEVEALGVLFDVDRDPSVIWRLGADYELADALVVGGGILIFEEGDQPPLDTWGQNDRFFFSLKWSF